MKRIRMGIAGAGMALVLAACGNTDAGVASAPTTSASSSVASSAEVATSAQVTMAPPTELTPVDPSTEESTSEEPTEETTEASPTEESPTEETTVEDPSTSEAAPTDSGEIDPVAAELIARVQAGNASVTSVTGNVKTDVGAQNIDITFVQELKDGLPVAMDMTIPAAGEEIRFILVDDKIYLSGAFAETSGKKYVEVNEDTKDATLKQLYATFQQSLDQASANQYTNFLSIVSDVKDEGPDEVDGQPAQKYSTTVDLTKIDSSGLDDATKASMSQLADAGLKEFPMVMWVNEDDRIVKVTQELEVMGQSVSTEVTMSKYNEPVDITAPDPKDVGQG